MQNYVSAEADSTYIQPFEQKLAIKTYVGKKLAFLNYEYGDEEKTFMPNNPVDLGLGISWHNSSISFGYGFKFMRDKELGKTESFDFQYHHNARKFVGDIFFQKYKGFYNDENEGEIELYPDLTINQYGIYGQYVFNGNKFSYKAVFDQTEKQLKSVGSFILGGGAYYSEIKSDSLVTIDEKRHLRNFQIGVSAGYAYSWIIKNNYFISASVTTGANFGKESGNDKLKIYPTAFPRISMGYNHKNWSIGMTSLINMTFVTSTENSSAYLFTGNLQLSFIKRFSTYNKIFEKLPKR